MAEFTPTLMPAMQATPMILLGGNTLIRGIIRDCEHGTSRNTVEAMVGVVGGTAGGVTGSFQGAAIGAIVCPGPVGAVAGAVIGSTFGFAAGDHYSRVLASEIFDGWEYNITEYRCKKCNRRFLCRRYTAQSRTHCPRCADDEDD